MSFQQVGYRKGHLLTIPSGRGEEPKRYHVMVIRYEVDAEQLLVRGDIGPPVLDKSMAILIDVWGQDALYRFMGFIADAVPNQHGEYLITVTIEDFVPVQRRSESRYQTRYPASFMLSTRNISDTETDYVQQGVGHATNISLGGLQLETDYNLPENTLVHCNVSAPGGTLHIQGRIISKRGRPLAGFVYGIELVDFDSLTSQRLNRLILRIERTGQRRVRSITAESPIVSQTKRVLRREPRRQVVRRRRGY